MDTREQNLNLKTIYINHFAKDAKISHELREKLRKGLEYISQKQSFNWEEKNHIFNALPVHLKAEVAMALHRGALNKIYFFQNKDTSLIYRFAIYLHPLYFNECEIIYKEGNHPVEMYFIVSGKINYVHRGYVYKTFQQGSYVGEIEIVLDIPCRLNTLQASTDGGIELLRLEKENLCQILQEYKDVLDEMQKIALKRIEKNKQEKQEIIELLDFQHQAEKKRISLAIQNLAGKNRSVLNQLESQMQMRKYPRQQFKDLFYIETDSEPSKINSYGSIIIQNSKETTSISTDNAYSEGFKKHIKVKTKEMISEISSPKKRKIDEESFFKIQKRQRN